MMTVLVFYGVISVLLFIFMLCDYVDIDDFSWAVFWPIYYYY